MAQRDLRKAGGHRHRKQGGGVLRHDDVAPWPRRKGRAREPRPDHQERGRLARAARDRPHRPPPDPLARPLRGVPPGPAAATPCEAISTSGLAGGGSSCVACVPTHHAIAGGERLLTMAWSERARRLARRGASMPPRSETRPRSAGPRPGPGLGDMSSNVPRSAVTASGRVRACLRDPLKPSVTLVA